MNKRLSPDGTFALRAGRVWTMTGQGTLDDAMILGEDGRVTAVGLHSALKDDAKADILDLGSLELAPGLVNAHTHLGLSHLPACGLPMGRGFAPWAGGLVKGIFSPHEQMAVRADIREAVDAMAADGVVLAAEVGGRHLPHVWEALGDAKIDARIFLEFLGFGTPGPPMDGDGGEWPVDDVPPDAWPAVAAAGHALYSTSPEALQRAKAWSSARGLPFSLHLAEDAGEVELLATGRGELGDFYRQLGVLPKDFTWPRKTPVAHAHDLGLLDAATLAVHCVHLTTEDIAILAASKCTVVLCPRSNANIGVGRARWEDLLEAGIPLALGTDGLCSAPDLDPLAELAHLRENIAADLTPEQGLAMITSTPAKALGMADAYGTIEPGKLAKFVVIEADRGKGVS